MRRVEHGPQRGAGPFRTRDFHAAAGLLRRHAQQGDAQAHLPGRTGGGEGVADLLQQCARHAAAVIRHREGDLSRLLRERKVQMSGPGGNGVLGDIQDVEGKVFHLYISRIGPTWSGVRRP